MSELLTRATEFIRGNTRTPLFGEMMRGIWASKSNPQRDGKYVRTVVRTGRLNPGKFYELTDGKGRFWRYDASQTVFLTDAQSCPEEAFEAWKLSGKL